MQPIPNGPTMAVAAKAKGYASQHTDGSVDALLLLCSAVTSKNSLDDWPSPRVIAASFKSTAKGSAILIR
eukprot:m.121823 g.121823  ORF g.121823 m.121823 type:complete len:70 (+) comp15648_c0_seq14:2812-3021(+)